VAGLRAGDRFSPEITRALDEATAVVVVWTAGALESDWVYAEATRAAAGRKAVMIRAADVDPARIPLPFSGFHACLVEDTAALLAAIEKRLSGEASPVPSSLPGRGFLLDLKQETLPPWASATRPASLLLARHRLVPFDDIHGLRARFVTWATEPPQHAFGRQALGCLLHAAGGLGKTRALIEIAEELTSAHGWLAGFVPRDVRGAGRELSEGALERLILGGRDAKGLMVIVDYAESRQDDVIWLADRLVRRAETVPTPARLVLLSRGSGVWWRELLLRSQSLQDLCSVGGEAYDEISLPEAIAAPRRRALFEASLSAFRARRGSIDKQQSATAALSADLVYALETESDYDRPLAVQIAALLQAFGVDIDGHHSMARLLDRVLGLEYEHWDKALKITGQPGLQKALKMGIAQTTLVGGADNAEAAQALIGRNDLLRARDVDEVMTRLSSILPDLNDGLAALEPDLIGEHHVLEVVTDALVDSCVDWAGLNIERRRHVLTVLNRATRPEHGEAASRAHAQLRRLVETQASRLAGDFITVAVETPGQLLDLCCTLELQIPRLEPRAIDAIAAALPERSLTLMPLSLRVAAWCAESARIEVAAAEAAADTQPHLYEETLSHLAGQVGTLGIRLSALGRSEEALAATLEAVEIYQRLAQARPDVFLPNLATGLTILGTQLSDLGCREEALTGTQKAVDICRRLVQARPDAFLPDLGGA
jgi:tetratricopeptide (TPR) repeat protein